ncbi:MAG TPA: hypothetical protein VNG13_15270 [Mycobacteriales bacterium]|nr:hypothetical protein [Mycobacteriales bacterium]
MNRAARRWTVGIGAFALVAAAVLPATAQTPPHTYPAAGPNDPSYAPVERGTYPTVCGQQVANAEEHYFYSFEPKCTPNAVDPGGAAGMSIDKAWHSYTTGDPRIVMAYIEGGVNWYDRGAFDLRNKVFVNEKELPIPCTGSTMVVAGVSGPCRTAWSANQADYDVNHDGVVNIEDYVNDPRVVDDPLVVKLRAAHGFYDPEDLIVAFSCFDRFNLTIGTPSWPDGVLTCSNGAARVDNDGDGFPHDISGWDFYDHQNDPATYDSTYDHSDNQMLQAGAEGNNAFGGVGLCPGCMVMPIKAGAEALDRGSDLAQAWLYACHTGVKVIISVTADLGYSSYMNQAIDYCWAHGTVMVEASNDFDSLDHQGGMFHPYVLPGNGEVDNTYGYDTASPGGLLDGAINLATTTFSTRSDETSWGTHAMFSDSTNGGSTSESTPTVGGTFGLLLSWGLEAADRHLIGAPLSNDEAIQVMRATATPITNPNLPWPGSAGDWNAQYGYGRPNLDAAMAAVAAGNIPPEAWFTGPTWYSLYDPTVTRTVPISGHLAAPRSGAYHWTLEYALEPATTSCPPQPPTDWTTIATGAGSKPYDGPLGTLDLAGIPQSFWAAPFALSKCKELETNDQYTVTLRLRVTDAAGRLGEDRRAIAVHHDPTLLPGYPLALPANGGQAPGVPGMNIDGSSQPALADLAGRGDLAMVFGDSDGYVHAIDPLTRRELPGWPVHTDPVVPDAGYPGIDPGHESVVAPLAVGDLFHTGQLDVVATSTLGRTYVWNAAGKLLPGWPRTLDRSAVTPAIPRPELDFTRLPHLGATASPVLVDLTGNHQLDVVQAAWDGNVYAWRPDATFVPGWPVRVDPGVLHPPSGNIMINDHKIDTTPAVAFLDGTHRPDIVVASQYDFAKGAGIQEAGYGNVFAYRADGTPLPGWPVSRPAVVVYYGSAQEFLTEGSTAPVSADVSGQGVDSVAISPGIFSVSYLLNAAGGTQAVYGPVPNPAAGILAGGLGLPQIEDLAKGNYPTDAPVTFTTSGAFGQFGSSPGLGYAQAGSGGASVATALLLNGSGVAVKNYERGYDAATGAAEPGFPGQMQGLDFLGEPDIAPVTAGGPNAVIDGADSSALHAFTATGQASGFPKFTTGWVLFSPAVGDLDTTGTNDVVAATREGYLMAWATPGAAAGNTQWWTYHHDEWRTGRYGTDSRPPGTLRNVRWTPGSRTATFVAPGDDWYTGTVAGYRLFIDGVTSTVAPQGPAGSRQVVALPAGARRVVVQAFDAAGNLGPAIDLAAANGHAAAGAGGIFPGAAAVVLPATGGGSAPGWAGLVAGLVGLGLLRRRFAVRAGGSRPNRGAAGPG